MRDDAQPPTAETMKLPAVVHETSEVIDTTSYGYPDLPFHDGPPDDFDYEQERRMIPCPFLRYHKYLREQCAFCDGRDIIEPELLEQLYVLLHERFGEGRK